VNILYISYWGIEEGLTQSSVIPHLHVLSKESGVQNIYFLTIERGSNDKQELSLEKVTFMPLYSRNLTIGLLNKISDFIRFSSQIQKLIRKNDINQIICRTALGGALGYLASKKTSTPFIVESFEPHADYMLEAKVWRRWGLKYQFQKYWELKVIQKAKGIVTVSKHYADYLERRFNREVLNFGCAVDLKRFLFNEQDRLSIRKKLGWSKNKIGIYVGKFGDIYYNETSYDIFKEAFDFFGSFFRLIILSPNDKEIISSHLRRVGISLSDCFINQVAHDQVPKYLSASDFAFSMVRPAPIRLYCSPIKDGEYWANGLPILSANDIGEDSEIIEREKVGAIFIDLNQGLRVAIERISNMIHTEDRIGRIRQIAIKYRNFEHLSKIYQKLLK